MTQIRAWWAARRGRPSTSAAARDLGWPPIASPQENHGGLDQTTKSIIFGKCCDQSLHVWAICAGKTEQSGKVEQFWFFDVFLMVRGFQVSMPKIWWPSGRPHRIPWPRWPSLVLLADLLRDALRGDDGIFMATLQAVVPGEPPGPKRREQNLQYHAISLFWRWWNIDIDEILVELLECWLILSCDAKKTSLIMLCLSLRVWRWTSSPVLG